MSLEELWQLFPIFLTEHKACWKEWYAEEASSLKKALPEMTGISHIGSTSVPEIWAKPIIDILAEVSAEADLSEYRKRIEGCGYIFMGESSHGFSFNKGYTETGFAEKVFHLHLRHAGDNRELYFRDYLIDHPETAREYEEMKLSLWKKYEHNRDAYTNAKTEFIKRYTETAMKLYAGRYS